MNRRAFLGGLVATASGLLVPEPVRAYSFAPAGGWPVGEPFDDLIATGERLDRLAELYGIYRNVTAIVEQSGTLRTETGSIVRYGFVESWETDAELRERVLEQANEIVRIVGERHRMEQRAWLDFYEEART